MSLGRRSRHDLLAELADAVPASTTTRVPLRATSTHDVLHRTLVLRPHGSELERPELDFIEVSWSVSWSVSWNLSTRRFGARTRPSTQATRARSSMASE